MEDNITAESLSAEFDQLGAEVGPDPEVLASDQRQQEIDAGSSEGIAEYKALLGQLMGMGFGIIAPNWKVSEREVDILSGGWAAVLYKYFPAGMTSFGAELGAGLSTAAVIGPRLRMPRVEAKPESELKDLEAANDDS